MKRFKLDQHLIAEISFESLTAAQIVVINQYLKEVSKNSILINADGECEYLQDSDIEIKMYEHCLVVYRYILAED